MIRNQWYVVLESKEVASRPVGVVRLGEKFVFWRDKNRKVNAAMDRCYQFVFITRYPQRPRLPISF